ncbi:MAG: hypothetical protein ACO3RV_01525, partial [Luteolibacter sp.]
MVGWWLRDFRPTNEDAVLLALPNDAPDPVTYALICEEITRIRSELSDEYARSEASQRADLEYDARVWLESVLPELMRCWIGTPWDFNGTAERPGDGPIACGYFVSTVLRDAGFNLDRFLLAKQASENIMRSFLPRASCVLRVGDDYESYADSLDSCDPGIYLIGLDTHVGFIVKRHQDGFRFIHSSGSNPAWVVEQDRENAWVLRQ